MTELSNLARLALALGLATFGLFMSLLGSNPEQASAAVICIPNGDDTYTQTNGDPADAPAGSIILDDGESCPATEPVPPPEELPDPPECDPCPEDEQPPPPEEPTPPSGESPLSDLGNLDDSEPESEGVLVARTDPSLDGNLPATGSDSRSLALVLLALALFAVVARSAASRLRSE